MGIERDALVAAIDRVLDAAGIERVWASGGKVAPVQGDALVLTLGEISKEGRCTLLRNPLPSEGGRTTMNFVDARLDAGEIGIGTWMWIGTWTRDIQRRLRREQALVDAGLPRTATPAWSLCAHPGLLAMVAMTGLPVTDFLDHLEWARSPHGFEAQHGRYTKSSLGAVEIAICSDVLWAKRIVREGSEWSNEGTVEATSEDAGQPWRMRIQMLVNDVLPETVASAAPGHDLADIVALGANPHRGATVASITQTPCGDENQIDVTLEPALVPLADPPPGVDRDWLTELNQDKTKEMAR